MIATTNHMDTPSRTGLWQPDLTADATIADTSRQSDPRKYTLGSESAQVSGASIGVIIN
jgi:hypothetical protein